MSDTAGGLGLGSADDLKAVETLAKARAAVLEQIDKRVVGQKEVVDHLLIALFSRGHCLFVGVPGLAKTLLISTLAEVLTLSFNRVQFTPDLMPSDITGTDILEEDRATGRRELRFMKGPIFANIVLADEVNRTPPKTQAALLQAMQEYRVTASGRTWHLDPPFLVFATQNPIEQEGTYPLPEAQLDRFLFDIRIGYPGADEEVAILRATTGVGQAALTPIIDAAQAKALQRMTREVPASDAALRYAASLARATRPKGGEATPLVEQYVRWGAGPRAGQALILGAKAAALLAGRHAVAPEDIRRVARPVLRHRVLPNFAAEAEGIDSERIVEDLIARVPEPRGLTGI